MEYRNHRQENCHPPFREPFSCLAVRMETESQVRMIWQALSQSGNGDTVRKPLSPKQVWGFGSSGHGREAASNSRKENAPPMQCTHPQAARRQPTAGRSLILVVARVALVLLEQLLLNIWGHPC